MPIDLSNLNISLDKFNAAAKGQLNIGQLKLSEDGTSVVRTNSRKTLTFLNKTQIRPEESLAIKNAFCEAFRREGLSDDAITDIRHKLGLRDTMRETLAAGNIKPLSAADVREIIDQYAGQVNQARGADKPHLETSADFYRGVSQKTLDDRKTVRDARNAKSESRMETTVGGTVNQMLDLLEGPAGDTALPIGTKAIALEICKALGKPQTLATPGSTLDLTVANNVKLKHSSSGTIVAQFRLDDGAEFSVDTNPTRDELLAQMRNALAPKQNDAPPKVEEEPSAGPEAQPKAPEEQPNAQGGQPKVQAEPPKTEPQAAPEKKVRNPFHEPVIEDLRRVFSIVKDPVSMTAQKLRVRSDKNFRTSAKGVQFSEETLDHHASIEVRGKLVKQALEPLVVALREVRGFDPRNTELLQRVRSVIEGDKSIDTDALVDEIIDALNTQPIDFTAQPDNAVEDDFDKPLNINELLGNNG
jgi:hypothetical protein